MSMMGEDSSAGGTGQPVKVRVRNQSKKGGDPNPNRMKPRITRACDMCKVRKNKCNGKLPCDICTRHGRECKFTAPYSRGKMPPIVPATPPSRKEQPNDGNKDDEFESRPSTAGSASASRRSSRMADQKHSIHQQQGDDEEESESENRPYKAQRTRASMHDESGYANARSSFQHGQNRSTGDYLFQSDQNTHRQYTHEQNSIFAYGDPPVSQADTPFMVLPTRKMAQALVDRYFSNAAATYTLLHRETIDNWLDDFLKASMAMESNATDASRNAVILVIFASAYGDMPDGSAEDNASKSSHYFQAAQSQLKKETGAVNLPTIQARLLQCQYFLTQSRVNQCWSTFSIVIGLIFAMGMHRKAPDTDTDSESDAEDLVEAECLKRAFWLAYFLDKYLSSSLGRPSLLRDDDIDQNLPLAVDHKSLSTGSSTVNAEKKSPVKATIFSIELSQIIGATLTGLHGVVKIPHNKRFATTQTLEIHLRQWRRALGTFFDDEARSEAILETQYNNLQLAHAQATMFLHRTSLLDNHSAPPFSDAEGMELRILSNLSAAACVKGAMSATEMINATCENNDNSSISWSAHHTGYTAVTVLYLHVVRHLSDPPASWMPYFEAGARCQEQLRTPAAKGTFAQKCNDVIQELRAETLGHMQKAGNRPQTRGESVEGSDEESEEESGEEEEEEGERNEGKASHFAGEWNDMNFDQSAPGGGVLYSLFNTVDTIHVRNNSDSLIDRIQRRGFASLLG